MNFQPYSQETMQSAFTANEAQRTLHREMITVRDAIDSEFGAIKEAEEYEKHKDMLEADEKWFLEHQGDNMEQSI